MSACDARTRHAKDDECGNFRIGTLNQDEREIFEAALPILYKKYDEI